MTEVTITAEQFLELQNNLRSLNNLLVLVLTCLVMLTVIAIAKEVKKLG